MGALAEASGRETARSGPSSQELPRMSLSEATANSGLSERTERPVDTASTGGMAPDGPRSVDLPSRLPSTAQATPGSTSMATSTSMTERDGTTGQARPSMSAATTTPSWSLALTEDTTDTTTPRDPGLEPPEPVEPPSLSERTVRLSLPPTVGISGTRITESS